MPTRRRESTDIDGDEGSVRNGRQVNHILRACNFCRKRRMRCDGGRPQCSGCRERDVECVYSEEDRRKTNTDQIEELRSRMERLEDLISNLAHSSTLLAAQQQTLRSPVATLEHANATHGHETTISPERIIRPLPQRAASGVLPEPFPTYPSNPDPPTYPQAGPSSALDNEHERDRFQRVEASAGSLTYSGATSLWTYTTAKTPPDRPEAEVRTLQPGDWIDWSRNLPPALNIARPLHDQAVECFGAYYAPWCLLVDMPAFLADLELCNIVRKPGSNRASPPMRTANYSPLLHCCIVYIGLYMMRDRQPALMQAYDSVVIRHCSDLIYAESDRASLGSLRGNNLFAICAHCARSSEAERQGSVITVQPIMTGFLYAGIALAGVHALSLNVNSSTYISSGHLTATEANLRDCAFWSVYIVDTLRAIPHGRQPILQDVTDIPLPEIDAAADAVPWQTPRTGAMTGHEQTYASMRSTTFHWLAKLAVIIRSMMQTLYLPQLKIPRNEASAQYLSAQLDQWYMQLPLKSVGTMPLPHILLLHMMYHLIVIFVHRPFHRSDRYELRAKCDEAASAVLPLLRLFETHHGLQNGHHNIVNIIFAAATVFLLRFVGRRPGDPNENQSINDFEECVQHMRRLGATWPEAMKASNVLQSLQAEYHIAPPASAGASNRVPEFSEAGLEGLHDWLSSQDLWGTLFPDEPTWGADVGGILP